MGGWVVRTESGGLPEGFNYLGVGVRSWLVRRRPGWGSSTVLHTFELPSEKDALARAGCPTGGGLAGRREAPDEGVVWGAEVSTGWGTARRYRVAEGAREKGGRRLL